MVGEVAVAAGLARLALQARAAPRAATHVLRAGEVRLGGAQPELGLVAAGIEAGDAGGLLEDGAPVGPGLTMAPTRPWLTSAGSARRSRHRRTASARRGRGSRGRSPIDGALAALDAAADVDLGCSWKGGGAAPVVLSRASITSAMLRAGRAAVPAKMTSSISPPRSGRAVLAHRPPQRLDEVRLASNTWQWLCSCLVLSFVVLLNYRVSRSLGLQPDLLRAITTGSNRDIDDEPITREHRTGVLIGDGTVRQFFPAL